MSRPLLLAALLALGLASVASRAVADPDCRQAGNISPGLQALILGFENADRFGSAALPVQDFLAGVTDISSPDRSALERRGTVRVASSGPASGAVSNDGQVTLEFTGIFARRQTFFRVPQHIRAHYVASEEGVTLYYDPAGAIQLGEAIPLVGIPVYRTINHVRIMRGKLLFFWGNNSGAEADRCYVAS